MIVAKRRASTVTRGRKLDPLWTTVQVRDIVLIENIVLDASPITVRTPHDNTTTTVLVGKGVAVNDPVGSPSKLRRWMDGGTEIGGRGTILLDTESGALVIENIFTNNVIGPMRVNAVMLIAPPGFQCTERVVAVRVNDIFQNGHPQPTDPDEPHEMVAVNFISLDGQVMTAVPFDPIVPVCDLKPFNGDPPDSDVLS